jgi:AraC-like DNA-binding protein
VFEETRAELAGRLLENSGAPLAEIAVQPGYQNPGNFTRAFRRWAGVVPSAFRHQRMKHM